ncbi:MFS domain-containing protein [Meloidogyne graminicola]|uniref:MFS domain-containing protein n=1 Tax=Meloidogyne graminicola TaxID=189291 RepID=A0A8S9ZUI0_9BILA|nr:MFS domain-containing protein [Meloidogyne graminicola]
MTEKLILFKLIFILFLDLISFTLILPLFPSILEYYSNLQQQNNEKTKEEEDILFKLLLKLCNYIQLNLNIPINNRYNNVFFGGILGSLFSFLQFISSPIFGFFSDHYGRKPLLLFSIFGSLISYWVWSISGNRLSKASISLAITIITDILPNEKRGKGMALIGICFSFSFIIGPSIGAYLTLNEQNNKEQFNYKPAQLAIYLTLIEIIILLLFLPETLNKKINKNNNF